jgi:hypothetical protein
MLSPKLPAVAVVEVQRPNTTRETRARAIIFVGTRTARWRRKQSVFDCPGEFGSEFEQRPLEGRRVANTLASTVFSPS